MSVVLVLGGVRSGKSRYAEGLLAGCPQVGYVAPGPVPDPVQDPEWAHRVRVHQESRPPTWTTIETADVPAAVSRSATPVLVDCLGTWVTRVVDDSNAWEDRAAAVAAVEEQLDRLVTALASAAHHVVLVSNEVGLGVVPEHRSGRLFRDLLGRTNARVADVADRVELVIAGRVLDLGSAPTVSSGPHPLDGR